MNIISGLVVSSHTTPTLKPYQWQVTVRGTSERRRRHHDVYNHAARSSRGALTYWTSNISGECIHARPTVSKSGIGLYAS